MNSNPLMSPISAWLDGLPQVYYLEMANCSLTGALPATLPRNLSYATLGRNNISGELLPAGHQLAAVLEEHAWEVHLHPQPQMQPLPKEGVGEWTPMRLTPGCLQGPCRSSFGSRHRCVPCA